MADIITDAASIPSSKQEGSPVRPAPEHQLLRLRVRLQAGQRQPRALQLSRQTRETLAVTYRLAVEC
jgi:hypothetical protein